MTSRTFSSGRMRLSAISVLAASVLVLSGCSNGEGPTNGSNDGATPSASSAASATQSATATPTPKPVYKPADAKGRAQNVPVPVKPALADKNSKEGVEAFTKYWFSLLNYGYETGDLTAWSKLSAASCSFCNILKNSVAVGFKEGRWQVGGRLSTPSLESKFIPGAATQQVVVQVIQEKIQYYKADKSVGRPPGDGSNAASVVIAAYSSGKWAVSDMHLIQ
ncbi:DUF6318 family protein [Arthrobacter sp. ZGTC131]|uniref:DUF6318 family protein n=1 Tax=Arthrobacter sp. ZGTC131 TaxID=2058898 RepID=UPI0011B049AE|nr:DUF6318 family protein [Arthrobacter sp. ZGTC131]